MKWEDDGSGVLELPSGRRARGRRMSASFHEDPEFGVYALLRPPHVPWPHRWVRWPDFGLPVDDKQARDALAEAWGRAVTARVEVACGGGRGRTGTMLAALAMLDGLDRDAAIAWVRGRYDARAVETPWQRWWLDR